MKLSRKTSDSVRAKLLIASTALRACRNGHLATLIRCCQAWKPIGNWFDPTSFEFQKLSRIIANLARANLAEREAEITILPWTQTEIDNVPASCRIGPRAWRAKKSARGSILSRMKTVTPWKEYESGKRQQENLGSIFEPASRSRSMLLSDLCIATSHLSSQPYGSESHGQCVMAVLSPLFSRFPYVISAFWLDA